jgi:hypothetical protein
VDRALISSLAFWADMGVETAYADEAVDRLKPVERRAPAAPARPAAPSAPTASATRAEPDIASA